MADELALTKIGDFLKVKYGGTNGAKKALGDIKIIKKAFMEIQTYLYADLSWENGLGKIFGGTFGGTRQHNQ